MRSIIKTVLIALSIGLATFIYIIKWSPSAVKGRQNAEKILLVSIGMKKQEVLEIMGNPVEKWGDPAGDSTYYYQTPFAAASNISVSFDSKERVMNTQPLE